MPSYLQWEKLPDFNAFPDFTSDWTLEFFPPAESWLVNSNFQRASRMQGSALAQTSRSGVQRARYQTAASVLTNFTVVNHANRNYK